MQNITLTQQQNARLIESKIATVISYYLSHSDPDVSNALDFANKLVNILQAKAKANSNKHSEEEKFFGREPVPALSAMQEIVTMLQTYQNQATKNVTTVRENTTLSAKLPEMYKEREAE